MSSWETWSRSIGAISVPNSAGPVDEESSDTRGEPIPLVDGAHERRIPGGPPVRRRVPEPRELDLAHDGGEARRLDPSEHGARVDRPVRDEPAPEEEVVDRDPMAGRDEQPAVLREDRLVAGECLLRGRDPRAIPPRARGCGAARPQPARIRPRDRDDEVDDGCDRIERRAR